MTKPSIVFVHGIWADGSSFSKVIPAPGAPPAATPASVSWSTALPA